MEALQSARRSRSSCLVALRLVPPSSSLRTHQGRLRQLSHPRIGVFGVLGEDLCNPRVLNLTEGQSCRGSHLFTPAPSEDSPLLQNENIGERIDSG